MALDGKRAKVITADAGVRNEVLNRAAFRLGQLVATGELDRTVVATALMDAARSCGLGRDEAMRTMRSGMRAGAQHPRQPRR